MNIENIIKYQYTSMENNLKTVASLLKIFPASDLTSYRDGGTGWTVTEVICHLRDFEAIFLERATLTLNQDMPELPVPSPDEVAAANHYSKDTPENALAGWQENRAKLLAFYRGLQASDWERVAMHPVRGKLTLLDQLTLAAQHDTLHFEQLTRVLAEKK